MIQAFKRLLSDIWVLASLIALMAPLSSSAQTNILYRETFRYCDGANSQDAATGARWVAFRSGSALGKPGFLKIFEPGTRSELEDYSTAPAGFSHGHAFWSRAVFGLWLFTREFSFDLSLLNAVEFDQRLSGVNVAGVPNGTRLAILIDGTWYVSDQEFRQPSPGRWASSATTSLLFPRNLTYGTVADDRSFGPQIPNTSGIQLPTTGTVQGFGVFLIEVNGRVRLDNFTIFGPAQMPPQTPQTPAPGTCGSEPTPPAGATPTPTRTPDGDGDDNGGGFEQIVPNETPPPALRTPTPKPTSSQTPSTQATATPVPAVFCPSSQQGRGKAYAFSRRATKVLLAQSSAVSLSALQMRNQAIFAVLAGRRLPVGSLVNNRAVDFDPVTGVGSVLKNAAGSRARVVLRGNGRTAMNRYISQVLGGATDTASPLLLSRLPTTQVLNNTQAMCLPEITQLVRAEIRRLRLAADVKVVSNRKR